MKIKIHNLSLSIFVFLTFALLFLRDSNPSVGILLALVVIFINFIWISHNEVIFFNFIIATLAWGATFNLSYRIGSIMLSDIVLVMLIISMSICKFKNKKNFNILKYKEVNFIIYFIIFALIIGIGYGNDFYNIFQDLKLVIYLIVPYIYLINKPYSLNKEFYLKLLKVLCICAIIVICQEIVHFFRIGVITMLNTGFANRDVTIQVQIVIIMSVVMIFLNEKAKIFSNFQLFLFEVMCFIACLLSFTRSIWIAYILAMITCIILNRGIYSFIKKTMLIVITIVIISIIIKNCNNELINNIVSAVNERVFSIFDSLTNNEGTFTARVNDSNLILNEKIKKISFLWGKGLGDTIYHYGRCVYLTFNENSVLYYTWKYGVVFTITVLIYLIKVVKDTLVSRNIIIIASSMVICIYIIVGNFSGNLNGYYLAPVLSMYFSYPKFIK